MVLIIGLLCLIPLLALAVQWRTGPGWAETLRVLLLFGLSLGVASPFLTERGVGAGDAWNYADAVADGVIQTRAGVVPMQIGQSEYAFNGRVHPLRTASYFIYATSMLDLATGHQLGTWGLQNLLLAGSLVAGVFSAYLCLRRLGAAGPWVSWTLAAVYLMGPGLLAAAYGMDLFMTVTTAPFLPIVMLALVRCLADRSLRVMAGLAAGLAACWVAHSPVALWLTMGCGLAMLVGFAGQRPRWRDLAVFPAALLLGAVLCVHGFVSSMTIDPRLTPAGYQKTTVGFVNSMASIATATFPASLRPVSEHGNLLGDFQLGYAGWLLLGLGCGMAWRRRSLAGAALVTMVVLFCCGTMPVPGLQRVLWEYLPSSVTNMTNLWPMQRLYLLLSVTVIFLGALHWPRIEGARGRLTMAVLLATGLGWSGWQAWHFVARGFSTRMPTARSVAFTRPENIDLTINSYAFLSYPSWFLPGPMDPEHGFRLRSRADMGVVATNWTAGRRPATAVTGRMVVAERQGPNTRIAPQLTLEPGKHYRLRFHFLTPRIEAVLSLRGETMWRDHFLPSYPGATGFGMDSGNNPELVLQTSSTRPEHVRLILGNLGATPWEWTDFADFTLEEYDRAELPFELQTLVPQLQVRANTAQDGWLETPRMYIPGYAATVDGTMAEVVQSPDGLVAVAVPAGRHTVAVSYPGTKWQRRAFWLTLGAWVMVLASAGGVLLLQIFRDAPMVPANSA